MILINKHNLSAVLPAVSKEESRYVLNGIHITKEFSEATDGHKLIRVTTPKQDAQNFPVIEGFTPNGFTECALPTDAAKQILKAIPKKDIIPILNHAALSYGAEGKVTAAVTDLKTPQVFTAQSLTGQMPRTDMVLAATDVPEQFSITLNASFLADLAKSAAGFSDSYNASVKIKFFGKDKAIRLEAKNTGTEQEWVALLMPLRD